MEWIKTKSKLYLGILAAALLVATLALAGCGSSSSSSSAAADSGSESISHLTVAAVPTPHAEILRDVVAPILADQGIELEVQEFTDYVLPNTATEQGEVDANYFQHRPYLDSFNEENGTHLVEVCQVHFEPFSLYSTKHDSLADLPDGATIAVPNDTTNEARALLLLEQEGLIEIDDQAGVTATPNDITSNPKNLKFQELEAALVPTVIDDVDVAAVNGNYALEAGLTENERLAIEAEDSLAAQTYANLLVVKEGNENNPEIQALAKALNTDEVRDYINLHYPGAVIAVF